MSRPLHPLKTITAGTQKIGGSWVCVHVSPFPFGGILFQVNQPLVFGETNLQAGPKWQNFVSILGALFGQDGGSTATGSRAASCDGKSGV